MKILLVEDEPDLGAIIKTSLSHHQYIVDWAIDGQAGWEYLTHDAPKETLRERTTYSLAIIDWMLPKISGIELCQRLRTEKYTLPILMLTARDRMEDKIAGLDAGADDYLVKPFGMAELLARLRALHRRAQVFQPIGIGDLPLGTASPWENRLQVGNLRLDYDRNAMAITNHQGAELLVSLTAKEFQLLEYLMQHPDRTLSHDQIRNRVWAFDSESASNVVAAQIRLLRKKLAESGCENAIETIRGFGYRLNSIHQ
jgi:DNA-binding response OmpR family regulator